MPPKKKTTKKKTAKKKVSKKKKKVSKKKKKPGGKTTCTPDIALRLYSMWRHGLVDSVCADILSITIGQIEGWLNYNKQKGVLVTVEWPVKERGGNRGVRVEKITLTRLRARAKASPREDYISKHERYIDRAAAAGQYNAAIRGMEWIMEKRYRKEFGRESEQEEQHDGPKVIRLPLAIPKKKRK